MENQKQKQINLKSLISGSSTISTLKDPVCDNSVEIPIDRLISNEDEKGWKFIGRESITKVFNVSWNDENKRELNKKEKKYDYIWKTMQEYNQANTLQKHFYHRQFNDSSNKKLLYYSLITFLMSVLTKHLLVISIVPYLLIIIFSVSISMFVINKRLKEMYFKDQNILLNERFNKIDFFKYVAKKNYNLDKKEENYFNQAITKLYSDNQYLNSANFLSEESITNYLKFKELMEQKNIKT